MTDDIVVRLRRLAEDWNEHLTDDPLFTRAAAEIERLREENTMESAECNAQASLVIELHNLLTEERRIAGRLYRILNRTVCECMWVCACGRNAVLDDYERDHRGDWL